MRVTCRMDTPLGPLTLAADDACLRQVTWGAAAGSPGDTPLLAEARAQIAAYFDRRLTVFDLPVDWGQGLNAGVRRAMAAIPFGQTLTYGQIARALGAPAQAVGQACGANPLPVVIPCHRVLGARGLGGFSAAGGVETKVWLLRHEGAAGLLI